MASSIQKLNLTDLRKFVNYNITLFASTVMGNGKPSDPIFVVTDQDSKWYFSLLLIQSYSDPGGGETEPFYLLF